MKTSSVPRQNQRGLALLSVIVLLIVFLIFAGAVLVQMAQEVNSAHNDGVSNRALSAADAGIHGMIINIEEAVSAGKQPANPVDYAYPEPGASPSVVSYHATIDKFWNPLAVSGSRYYLITSTGSVNTGFEQRTRTVRVIVRAQSVAAFASASNYENNQFGKPVWYTPDQRFDGPVYSGGPMHVVYDDTQPSSNAIFQSSVQTPNTPVWNPGNPDDSADWGSIDSGGAQNFTIGGNPIGLPQPQDNLVIASEALNGDCCSLTAFPSGPPYGLYMNKVPAITGSGALFTGMYVIGNAVINGSNAGGVETFTITSPNGKFAPTTVKIDFNGNTTTVTQAGNTTTYSGVPSGDSGSGVGNGAFFVDGNATLMLGSVIEGQYTLSVPDYAQVQNNIVLSGAGNITYVDPNRDELGLWANNVILNTSASNISLDASIIAGFPGEGPSNGAFYNNRCNPVTCTAGNQGTLTITGAVMENIRGAVGKFISLVPPVHVGFDRKIIYDSRFISNPPPFYPITGNYSIIAWDDLGF